MKAAVIDLGFNSVKMVCYSVDQAGQYRAYRQDAYRARLGEGLDSTGILGRAQTLRTIGFLKILSEIAEMEAVDRVIPVATSAVREAANGPQFAKAVLEEARLALRVISAKDEALYSFAGAMSAAPNPDVIFFDLGGGSLEIVREFDFRITKILSLPLGVLRLSFEYGDGGGQFYKRQARIMKRRIAELLPNAQELHTTMRTRLVGVGGTVRAIARRDQEFSEYPSTKIQSYSIPYAAVSSMSKTFLKMSKKELGNEREIGNRADTIAAGTLVVKMLMKSVGANQLTASSRGLREGVLSMYLRDRQSFHRGSVKVRDVEHFVRESSENAERSSAGYPLMFERARLVDRREATLLAEALRLVSVTQPSVNLRSFFYSIMEEDSPANKHDQLIIAAVAVTARNERIAELMVNQYSALLGRKDREDVKRLATFYSFMKTLNEAGVELKLTRHGGELRIRVWERRTKLPVSLLSRQTGAMAELLGSRVGITFVPAKTGPIAGMEHPG